MNLLVSDEWVVKLADMGLARFNSADNLQSMSRVVGTYAYLAPEVYYGETYGAMADVYSMGIVFWEIATRIIKGKILMKFSLILQDAMKFHTQNIRTLRWKCKLQSKQQSSREGTPRILQY